MEAGARSINENGVRRNNEKVLLFSLFYCLVLFSFFNFSFVLMSHSVVSRLQSGRRGRAPLDLVLDDIRSLACRFKSLYSSHVKRVGNMMAPYITRLCLDREDCQIFCNALPLNVIDLAELYMSAI